MQTRSLILAIISGAVLLSSCKKEGCTDPNALNYDSNAKKDNGSCVFESEPVYNIPSSYNFTDANGNNTVSYSGQTERLDQLEEMVALMDLGTTTIVNAQDLKDMFANTNGDGNGNFTFNSTKQFRDKCFAPDVQLFESWMDSLAVSSLSNGTTASEGQAGTVTSGTSTYLLGANGIEYNELIEKGLMGAVFMYQSLNVYFGSGKMDVDNTSAVDPTNGKYYTTMEHHFDEAFGYFGVDPSFPSIIPTRFWGKYCNSQNAILNSNADMMDNFLKGRAALSSSMYSDRYEAIAAIRREWEEISAYQTISYIDQAIGYFGTDQAKFLHVLSEAYAFAWNLRYAPTETRKMTATEHTALMALFNDNFWSMTIVDLNNIKAAINAKY